MKAVILLDYGNVETLIQAELPIRDLQAEAELHYIIMMKRIIKKP